MHSAASLAFRFSSSFDFTFSACLARSILDLPVVLVCSALCFSISCRSPMLYLMFRSIVLGVASSGNRRCSTRYLFSGLRASSLLRVPLCDGISPQCVSYSHGRQDFEGGVLCYVSPNRRSMLNGRFCSLTRSQVKVGASRLLPLLLSTRQCTRLL